MIVRFVTVVVVMTHLIHEFVDIVDNFWSSFDK